MAELRPQLRAATASEEPRRVTVVRSGGLGDTLLTLPVLRVLSEACPGYSLTFVGSAWAARLWPLLALPCRLLRSDGPQFTPLFAPDVATDPTGAFDGADVAVVYSGDDNDVLARNAERLCRGPVLVWPAAAPEGTHAAWHFLHAVCEPPPERPPIPPLRPEPGRLEWARQWIEATFGRARSPLAAHPGSGGRRKCWPENHFAATAEAVERPVVLIEGPADEEAVAAMRSCLPRSVPAATASHLPLPDLAALLCCCHAFVGNDSGVSHLAGMLGVPTVAVFGPTDPAVWAPLGPNARAVGGRGTWPGPDDVLSLLRRASD